MEPLRTLLIVDDIAEVRQDLRRCLEEQAELIMEAPNTEVAVCMLPALQGPGLVLFECHVPGRSPAQFIRTVRAEFPHLLVVATCVNLAPDARAELLHAGAHAAIDKPDIRADPAGMVRLLRGDGAGGGGGDDGEPDETIPLRRRWNPDSDETDPGGLAGLGACAGRCG